IADKILLMLMYYREYRTQFHIGIAYKISESRVCEIISEMESILIKDKRFHLSDKKQLKTVAKVKLQKYSRHSIIFTVVITLIKRIKNK
ncbi:MAG: transposase family protein, partial [Bacteroidetes bacterium]|nr:transposase family protein [Bacteroidota bacterium]